MNLVDLSLLLDVARLRSFAAVARLRNTDPSSVSRIVAGIEEKLGIRVFERSTRRMELTEAGDLYLSRVEPILEQLDSAREEALAIRSAPRGTLRLTASVTFGQQIIGPLLPEFRETFPGIRVEALFTDVMVDLIADRIDLAVRLAPQVSGDLVVTKLCDTRYMVVASPSYLTSVSTPSHPRDLAGHRLVLFPFQPFRSRWLFRDSDGMVMEQPVNGDLILSPASALRDAALAGLGAALLPDWLVAADVAAGRLIHVLNDWDVTATNFETAAWLAYPSRSYLPGKTRAMIDFLKSHIVK